MQKYIEARDKSEFRKFALERLKNISKKSVINKDRVVIQKLLFLLKVLKSQTILLYLPLNIESNIFKLIKKLSKKSLLYVPFMQEISFKIVRYRLPLYKKKFNILEPSKSDYEPKSIDIAIVPIIGIDKEFRRVGFGAGMYDRFFARFKNIKKVVFVQREALICKYKITDSFDIKGDYLITSDRFIKNRKGKFDNIYTRMYNFSFY